MVHRFNRIIFYSFRIQTSHMRPSFAEPSMETTANIANMRPWFAMTLSHCGRNRSYNNNNNNIGTDTGAVKDNVENEEENRTVLVEPEMPIDLCCGGNCVHCVWDSYFEEMELYNAQQQQQQQLRESERKKNDDNHAEEQKEMYVADVSMDAFAELQRRLMEKRKKDND